MIEQCQKQIVVTGVQAVTKTDKPSSYAIDLLMEIDGTPRVLSVDMTTIGKRQAFGVRCMRDLVGLDLEAEARLRTAAACAYAGELKKPMVISAPGAVFA